MSACGDDMTVSVRYRPDRLLTRPELRVAVDGKEPFYLSEEGVRRLTLPSGQHVMHIKCGLRSLRYRFEITSHTRIIVGFDRNSGSITVKVLPVLSPEELDIERQGY